MAKMVPYRVTAGSDSRVKLFSRDCSNPRPIRQPDHTRKKEADFLQPFIPNPPERVRDIAISFEKSIQIDLDEGTQVPNLDASEWVLDGAMELIG